MNQPKTNLRPIGYENANAEKGIEPSPLPHEVLYEHAVDLWSRFPATLPNELRIHFFNKQTCKNRYEQTVLGYQKQGEATKVSTPIRKKLPRGLKILK